MMKLLRYIAIVLAVSVVFTACQKSAPAKEEVQEASAASANQAAPVEPAPLSSSGAAGDAIVVSSLTGTAQFQHTASGEKQPLTVGQILVESDIIISGDDAVIVISLEEGKEIHLGSDTVFALSAIRRDSNGNVNILALKQGSIVNVVDTKLEDNDVYEVHTPRLVMSVRGTSNYMETGIDGDTVIGITGETHVFSQGHSFHVPQGSAVSQPEGATPAIAPANSASLPPLAASFASDRDITYPAISEDDLDRAQQNADSFKPSQDFADSSSFANALFSNNEITTPNAFSALPDAVAEVPPVVAQPVSFITPPPVATPTPVATSALDEPAKEPAKESSKEESASSQADVSSLPSSSNASRETSSSNRNSSSGTSKPAPTPTPEPTPTPTPTPEPTPTPTPTPEPTPNPTPNPPPPPPTDGGGDDDDDDDSDDDDDDVNHFSIRYEDFVSGATVDVTTIDSADDFIEDMIPALDHYYVMSFITDTVNADGQILVHVKVIHKQEPVIIRFYQDTVYNDGYANRTAEDLFGNDLFAAVRAAFDANSAYAEAGLRIKSGITIDSSMLLASGLYPAGVSGGNPTGLSLWIPIEKIPTPPIGTRAMPLLEDATEPPFEDATEPPFEDVTEPPSEDASKPPTEDATEPPSVDATEPPSEDATEPPSEDATEPPSEDATEPPSVDATEPPTEDATEPPTEDATEPPTEE